MLLLLHLSYIALCLGSVFGAVLFMGFTFHLEIRYPLAIVMIHLAVVLTSFVLFSIWMFDVLSGHTGGILVSHAFSLAAYAVFAITLGSGLFFFLRYDARRKQMRVTMVGAHIVLACLTFIAVSSLLGMVIVPVPPNSEHVTGRWAILHRVETVRARSHHESLTHTPSSEKG